VKGACWTPERIIVLTSSTDTIDKHIRQRNRPHESAENMVRRFRLIDSEFRRLAPRYPNSIVINRDGMEFHERTGLVEVVRLANLPAFREITYQDLD
jgi:deoxyadenosine/deoxycytidine kinase